MGMRLERNGRDVILLIEAKGRNNRHHHVSYIIIYSHTFASGIISSLAGGEYDDYCRLITLRGEG